MLPRTKGSGSKSVKSVLRNIFIKTWGFFFFVLIYAIPTGMTLYLNSSLENLPEQFSYTFTVPEKYRGLFMDVSFVTDVRLGELAEEIGENNVYEVPVEYITELQPSGSSETGNLYLDTECSRPMNVIPSEGELTCNIIVIEVVPDYVFYSVLDIPVSFKGDFASFYDVSPDEKQKPVDIDAVELTLIFKKVEIDGFSSEVYWANMLYHWIIFLCLIVMPVLLFFLIVMAAIGMNELQEARRELYKLRR